MSWPSGWPNRKLVHKVSLAPTCRLFVIVVDGMSICWDLGKNLNQNFPKHVGDTEAAPVTEYIYIARDMWTLCSWYHIGWQWSSAVRTYDLWNLWTQVLWTRFYINIQHCATYAAALSASAYTWQPWCLIVPRKVTVPACWGRSCGLAFLQGKNSGKR